MSNLKDRNLEHAYFISLSHETHIPAAVMLNLFCKRACVSLLFLLLSTKFCF